MYFYFKKDSRQFALSCNAQMNYDPTVYVEVWVEDPSKIDIMFSWSLADDDKTLIKGAESHAPI